MNYSKCFIHECVICLSETSQFLSKRSTLPPTFFAKNVAESNGTSTVLPSVGKKGQLTLDSDIELGLSNLSISRSMRHLTTFRGQIPQEYKLPTTVGVAQYKQTILDISTPNTYKLPSVLSHNPIEKVLPDLAKWPKVIEDPSPLRNGVNGNAPIKKEAARMIGIRRLKMNKHQLKKLRKRMLFHNRKMADIKKKRKESKVVAHLNMIRSWGTNFNAEEFVKDQVATARKGGFKVDILETSGRKETLGPLIEEVLKKPQLRK